LRPIPARRADFRRQLYYGQNRILSIKAIGEELMAIELKVLIVDDSVVIGERLAAMLGEIENVAVIGHARDVREAIELNHALRPDVLILDISMPGGNGFDVLRDMRQTAIDPVTIMLTNSVYCQYRQQALKLGAQYFLDKSAEFQKVPEVLRMIAAIRIADVAAIAAGI
jgi:two-component system response regulator DevR